MTRSGAAVGSFVFAVGQPGVMGFLVPYWITGGWDGSGAPLAQQVAGAALLAAGVCVLANTVIRFAVEGLGTPFPAAPTENLVVGGLYRYVRNPMYLAVIASILGQAAMLGRASLLVYAAILWATVASFVLVYEESTLSSEYGEQYAAYRRAVRAWWPRLTPWRGATTAARAAKPPPPPPPARPGSRAARARSQSVQPGASSSAAGPSTVTVDEPSGRWSPSPSALTDASLRVHAVRKLRMSVARRALGRGEVRARDLGEEVAWEALSDAGGARADWRGSDTAVYCGLLAADYGLIHARTRGSKASARTSRPDLVARLAAADADGSPDGTANPNEPLVPSDENWYRLRRWSPRQGYEQWPSIVKLAAENPALGLNENRGEALIAHDKDALRARMSHYLDPSVAFGELGPDAKRLTYTWAENGDAIRNDWPRVPLPDSFDGLLSSARLGQRIAKLLDVDARVVGVDSAVPALVGPSLASSARTPSRWLLTPAISP